MLEEVLRMCNRDKNRANTKDRLSGVVGGVRI